MRENLTIIFV
jgi:dynein heavy chain 2